MAVVVRQESARVFASVHARGRSTTSRVQEDRWLVNHYYFFLRDCDRDDGLIQIGSYPPSQIRLW